MASSGTDSSKRQMMKKVLTWLDEERLNPTEIKDPNSELNIVIPLGEGDGIGVIFQAHRRDSLEVTTEIAFTPIDRNVFSALKGGPKNSFLQELNYSLIMLDIAFDILPNEEKMEHVLVTKRIYFDGLSKDHLLDVLHRVYRAAKMVKWCYSKYLHKGNGTVF